MKNREISTDPGLSASERKQLRSREAKEAIADHEDGQRALYANRERLRSERLAREAAAGPMLYPAPELPDDTPIDSVRFLHEDSNGAQSGRLENRRRNSRGFW